MPIEVDIVKLLKSEGFRTNETINEALQEFLSIVNDENEEMEETSLGIEEDDEDEDDD